MYYPVDVPGLLQSALIGATATRHPNSASTFVTLGTVSFGLIL